MARTIETAGGKTYVCIGDAESCLREIIRNELGNDCEEMFCEVLERAWSAGQDQNCRERNEREKLIEWAQKIKNHCEDADCEECCFYAEDRNVCTLCKWDCTKT